MKKIFCLILIMSVMSCGSFRKMNEINESFQSVESKDISRVAQDGKVIISEKNGHTDSNAQLDKSSNTMVIHEKFNTEGSLAERTTTIHQEDEVYTKKKQVESNANTLYSNDTREQTNKNINSSTQGESKTEKFAEAKEPTLPGRIIITVLIFAILIFFFLIHK